MQNVLRCLLLAALVCLELRRRLFRFFFRRKEQGTTVSCQKQAVHRWMDGRRWFSFIFSSVRGTVVYNVVLDHASLRSQVATRSSATNLHLHCEWQTRRFRLDTVCLIPLRCINCITKRESEPFGESKVMRGNSQLPEVLNFRP